jgi:23S rRNA (uridine2552-2'-O)-methyltransferase
MSKNNKTSNWVKNHSQDPFVKKSIQEKYRSRAAYKLKEIDDKYKILSKQKSVIDLGCAPGSWLQFLKEYKNIQIIIGIDLKDINPIENIKFIRGDINNSSILSELSRQNIGKTGVVLSDIAPNITGISDIDQSNFSEIALNILVFCKSILKPNGMLVMKYFLGSGIEDTKKLLNKSFNKISVFKPTSSKKKSNEVYLICSDFKVWL